MIQIDPKKIKKFQISRLYKNSGLHAIYIEVDLGDIDLEPPVKKKKVSPKDKFHSAHGTKE